jgi:Ca2+-binding RTX toxin-like protein
MAILAGSEKADWLIGTGAADTIDGLGGNDVLKGGGGADTLNGGAGIDTAVYADSLTNVSVDLRTGVGKFGAAEGDLLLSIENLQGSSYGDELIGNSIANDLRGLEGNDRLQGLGGADLLDGGYGHDVLVGGAGGDVLIGGEGNDLASYGSSPAAVFVSLMSHTASGGDAQGDTLNGVEGLLGSPFADGLSGDNGANSIDGADGNDTIKGFGGDDFLYGYLGQDMITGGTGRDVMSGGFGTDTFFWFSTDDTGVTEARSDTITDFYAHEGDRMDLSFIDANVYAAGDQAFTFIGTAAFSGTPGEINYYESGGDTYIQMQTGTSSDVEGMIRMWITDTPQASWFVL